MKFYVSFCKRTNIKNIYHNTICRELKMKQEKFIEKFYEVNQGIY